MPSYYYRARDANGRSHEGIEVAGSEDEVLRILENSKLVPVLIESRNGTGPTVIGGEFTQQIVTGFRKWKNQIPQASVALFARQLATMIGVGLPLVRSLRSIARDHYDRRLGEVLEQVATNVQKGDSLSAALAKHSEIFDEVFVSLVNTGEISGTLDEIMNHTAGYLERAETLRLKVEAALRYPTFVLSVAGAVIVFMLVVVVPRFSGIYEKFKVPLPIPTQVLLWISHAITSNLFICSILAILGVVLVWSWVQTAQGRARIDRAKFNLPVFGPLIRMYAVTKFARTLGILTTSGTQILHALKVLRPVPGNKVLEEGIDAVRSQVEQGSSLAKAMESTGVFPEMLVQMTATGEETGKLDIMLIRTAEFYEQRVTAAVEGLSSLIEPIAIVVLGLVIGVMLIALYLPIFTLGQAMKSGLLGH